ncbi:DUF1853 family protein [Sungkyunkwania multivorans]|uniref:DUF1853 family protein n=1 Tax=Sungkyunkwania multivorans TaxID=1173618 RepID=A0ABW3CWU1_9FLAO
MNDILRQYQGFLATPSLFDDDWVVGVPPFETKASFHLNKTIEIPERLRLGQRVEYFFSEYIDRSERYSLLAKNIQIKRKKATIGELDFLIKDLERRVNLHIELICKFYLFDPTFSNEELKCWIGPNRKDLLIEKVDKLKKKQLPLLYAPETQQHLQGLDLVTFREKKASKAIQLENFEQSICFKAQLFVPKEDLHRSFEEINKECIAGFYLNQKHLNAPFYKKCRFYLPKKYDWVSAPSLAYPFQTLEEVLPKIDHYIQNRYAPLCWSQLPDGTLERFFIVWW